MISWRLEIFETLGSTSDACIARAKAGEPEGLAVLARRQTAGRGSRGRAWLAPAGNLNLSVLLRPARPAAQAGMFSLAAGLALCQALQPYLASPLVLKWPNDVLLGGQKLAGILIDAAPSGQKLDWLVIGLGVNIATAPEIPGRATTCLGRHGAGPELVPLAQSVLAALSDWAVAPPEKIRQAWLASAHPIGTPLTVQGEYPARKGRFAGLSPAGELLLDTEQGSQRISTGDILLGAA